MNPSSSEPCLVSMKTACALTSLSRTMLNRYRSEGRFPEAVPLGDRRVAFVKSEVSEWISARIAARGANDNAKAAVAA
ncbi:helix-turn-helix transcriptional regulator [Bradyrhizobium genosp. P]|uniref:helix-turn-helix transcriptional regulator n=1 Tax=Bradyrhizobium genosp. P TaxID=83641 RepID=UPI003CF3FB84